MGQRGISKAFLGGRKYGRGENTRFFFVSMYADIHQLYTSPLFAFDYHYYPVWLYFFLTLYLIAFAPSYTLDKREAHVQANSY